MTIHSYINNDLNSAQPITSKSINKYLKQKKIQHHIENQTIETLVNKKHWLDRDIALLINSLQINDTLIVYDLPHLARSSIQVYQIFNLLNQKKIHLHMIKHDLTIKFERRMNTQKLLQLFSKNEESFVYRRTTEPCNRKKLHKKAQKYALSKQQKQKLNQHEDQIMQYLQLKVSKHTISKLISCPQEDLFSWLKEKDGSNLVDN